MLYIDLGDKIISRAKHKRIARYSRVGTNIVLWGGLGGLIVSGTIGLKFIGEIMIIGVANKVTKKIIKGKFGNRVSKSYKTVLER